MAVQEIISVGFNYQKTEQDKEKVLGYLREVRSAITDINGIQYNGGGLTGLIKNEEALFKVQEQLNKSTTNYVKTQSEAAASSKAQTDEVIRQNKEKQSLLKTQQEEARLAKLTADADIAAAKAEQEAIAIRIAKIKEENEIIKQIGAEQSVEAKQRKAEAEQRIAQINEEIAVIKQLNVERKSQVAPVTAPAETITHEQAVAPTDTTPQVNSITTAYERYTFSLRENLAQQIENENAIAGYKAQLKTLNDEIAGNGGAATEAQTAKMVELREQILLLTQSNASLITTQKNLAKEMLADSGSVEELRAQLNNLQAAYQAMGEAARNSISGETLKNQIDVLEPRVKELEASIGFFNRNVGNYPKGSYVALEAELKEVTQAYNQLTAAERSSSSGVALNARKQQLQTELNLIKTQTTAATQIAETGIATIGRAAGTAFGYIRQIAYILPGIGIAGIFSLIFDGIMKAVQALGLFSDKNVDLLNGQTALNNAVSDGIEKEKELNNLRKENIEQYIKNEQAYFQATKDVGQQQATVLANEKAIADQRAANAKDDLFNRSGISTVGKNETIGDAAQRIQLNPADAVKLVEQTNDRIETEISQYTRTVIELGQKLATAKDEDRKKELTAEKENIESLLREQRLAYDKNKAIIADYYATVEAQADKQAQIIKFNADEQRKLILQTIELEANLTKFRNQNILNDGASTEDQRLAALKQIEEAQIRINEAQKRNVLNNPTSSDVDRVLAVKKAAEANTEAIKTSERQQFLVREEYRKRDVVATEQYNDTKLRQDQEYYEKAQSNPNLSLQQQLSALDTSISIQKQILAIDHAAKEEQLKNTNRTEAEIEADEADYQSSITTLVQKGTTARLELIRSYNEKVQQESASANNALKNAIQSVYVSDAETSEQYTKDVSNLNTSLEKKEISLYEYNRRRKQLDDDYNIYSLASQIAKDKKELTETKLTFDEENALRVKIAQEEKELSDQQLEQYKQALSEKSQLEQEFIQDVLALGQTIGDASFQRRIDNYERLKDASNAYYAQEIQNIQNSAAIGAITDQQAADRTTVLNAEKTAAADLLDKKEREIKQKQARFDKAASIAGIVEKAAVAEVGALSLLSNPLTAALYPAIAALIAATSAAQIATIIATPIPAYKDGLKGNKGAHIGLYGEAGAELIEKPGFAPFIADKATLDYLPANTRITPIKADEIDVMMNRSLYKTTAKLFQPNNSDKKAVDTTKMLMAQNTHNTRQIVKAIQKSKTSIHIHDNAAYLAWKKGKMNW